MSSVLAHDTLYADFRNRPPEMILKNGKMSGPLKEIIEQAATKMNTRIVWSIKPFSESVRRLKLGKVDIVPKVFKTRQRRLYIRYLTPLSKQTKRISFLAHPEIASKIKSYDDLYNYTIGVRDSAFYFQKFNNDKKLNTRRVYDSYDLIRLFINRKIDIIPIINQNSLEVILQKENYTNYRLATYSHETESGVYYATSRKSKHINLINKLDEVLAEMIANGEIKKFYDKYKVSVLNTNKELVADFRHRPPNMIIKDKKLGGPLKEVLETAANYIGYKVRWNVTAFENSLTRLKAGFVDVVPRAIKTNKRMNFSRFTSSLGTTEKNIYFLVRKKLKQKISKYDHLKAHNIGLKKGTYYFEPFQSDDTITKVYSNDDSNMSHMFIKKRFDVIILLDPEPMIEALHKRKFYGFTLANYRIKNKLEVRFAVSKKSRFKDLSVELDQILTLMLESGEINEIFKKHNVSPPLSH